MLSAVLNITLVQIVVHLQFVCVCIQICELYTYNFDSIQLVFIFYLQFTFSDAVTCLPKYKIVFVTLWPLFIDVVTRNEFYCIERKTVDRRVDMSVWGWKKDSVRQIKKDKKCKHTFYTSFTYNALTLNPVCFVSVLCFCCSRFTSFFFLSILNVIRLWLPFLSFSTSPFNDDGNKLSFDPFWR